VPTPGRLLNDISDNFLNSAYLKAHQLRVGLLVRRPLHDEECPPRCVLGTAIGVSLA